MKIHNVEQDTPEWYQLRAGLPTASEFNKILTMTGKKSTQADDYANRLTAEWIMKDKAESFTSEWMERGMAMEQEAVDFYAFHYDADPEPVGFITNNEETYGCSPDRLLGNGGLELKCPAPQTQVAYLLDNEKLRKAYHVQVQGQIFVAEFEFVDLFSYHPDLPKVRLRIEPDLEYQKLLEEALIEFCAKLSKKKQTLREKGIVQ